MRTKSEVIVWASVRKLTKFLFASKLQKERKSKIQQTNDIEKEHEHWTSMQTSVHLIFLSSVEPGMVVKIRDK